MYQLICEGVCNPRIATVDDMARRFLEDRRLDRPNDGEALFILQRALVYTDHSSEGNLATCTVCGHQRGFGGRIHRAFAYEQA